MAASSATACPTCVTINGMDEFPVVPPIIVKDVPKPLRLTTIKEARDCVDEAMRLGRPVP
jgi:hypothetical protein